MNVAFVPPKKQNYSRQQVFLPKSDQRYDMNQFSQEIKSMGLKNQVSNFKQIPQTYVQSFPVMSYQTQSNYVQTTPPNVIYQQPTQTTSSFVQAYPQKIVSKSYGSQSQRIEVQPQVVTTRVSRVIRNENGEFVNVPL